MLWKLSNRIGISIFEQASISAGSFFFFIFSARFLGPLEFGNFVSFLIPAQIIHSIGVQWILLPITTTTGSRPGIHLLKTSLRRCAILTIASPPFAFMYGHITEIEPNLFFFTFVVVILIITMIAFDTLRYISIRIGQLILQSLVNIARWSMSFIFVLISLQYSISSGSYQALFAFVAGILTGIVILVAGLSKFLRRSTSDKPSEDFEKSQNGNALLSLGIANALFNLSTSVALTLVSVGALGALQAFRSLVNWVPLVLQYLETHFASNLARRDIRSFSNSKWLAVFVVIGTAGETAIWVYGDQIIQLSVGPQFAEFKWLLGAVFAHVVIQSFVRTIGIEVRLSRANGIIWCQAFLSFFGAVFIAGAILTIGQDFLVEWIVSIMIVIVALQAVSIASGISRMRMKK